jgi:hypothetical protein
LLKQVSEILDLLDGADVTGAAVAAFFAAQGYDKCAVKAVSSPEGSTDFVCFGLQGRSGRTRGGTARTLGVVGRLGGVGARPHAIGLVSDAEGAAVALAVALKLWRMQQRGDTLAGDVIVTTHICPHAPVLPHQPVPFMGPPVPREVMNAGTVYPAMEAIVSVDTTRGNRVLNLSGFAITPTVKEGYILRASPDLLQVMEWVSGRAPVVLPLATQDITPSGNDLVHINSIVEPATVTDAPVVGVAITSEAVIPGCATGATHELYVEQAARFIVEVAKGFGEGKLQFFEEAEFQELVRRYGSMKHLQTMGH